MTDTQGPADAERYGKSCCQDDGSHRMVPAHEIADVLALYTEHKAERSYWRAEAKRLRHEKAALRGLIGEVYMDLVCPEGSGVIERCRHKLLNVDAALAQAEKEADT